MLESLFSIYNTNSSWDSLHGYGSFYAICGLEGQHLYLEGKPCSGHTSNKKDDFCDISSLRDGEYVWRVSGALESNRNDIAWDFCSVQGGAMTQVIFQINKDGSCTPLDVKVYTPNEGGVELAAGSGGSTSGASRHIIPLRGSIKFSDLEDVELQSSHMALIREAIANVLSDVSSDYIKASDILILSLRDVLEEEAMIAVVDFEADVDTLSFGQEWSQITDEYATFLVQKYLEEAISSGVFAAELVSLSYVEDVRGFENLNEKSAQFVVAEESLLAEVRSMNYYLFFVIAVVGLAMFSISSLILVRIIVRSKAAATTPSDNNSRRTPRQSTEDINMSIHEEDIPNEIYFETIHDTFEQVDFEELGTGGL